MDIYSADEQLHRTLARASQRARYAGDPRRLLAARVEADVVARLRARGYTVERTGHNDHFDLLANGLRIEVKAATWSVESPSRGRYQANLRGNDADALIFGCQNGALHYFVIPFAEVRGLCHIKISAIDPASYTGRWAAYLEAWPLLDELIVAQQNGWQWPLMEE